MYLIKNGTLHVGDGTVLAGMDLLTEGRRIKQIGARLEAEDAEVIDAAGCEVFPGFIDPHSVIGAMGGPGRYPDHNEATGPITPELSIRYSIDPDEVNEQEFYKSGITALGLVPGHTNVMGGQAAVFKTAPGRMADRLLRENAALKCSVTEDVKRTYGEKNQLPKTRMGAFYLFQENLRAARAQKPEERTAAQKAIIRVFEEREMPVFAAASTKGEIDGILQLWKGEKVPLYLVDAFAFTDCIEELKEAGTGIILGNLSNMSQVAKNGMKLERMKELVENGSLLAFSNTCSGFSEGREVLLWTAIEVYRAGIDAEEVIKMMCLNPAKMLGVEAQIGTLEEGKDADLSVFTGHPVKTYAAKVKHSMVNGEVIF